jgi:hypothetical protein
MPTDIAKYSIELFKVGGEGAGIEEVLDRHADLKVARSIYRDRVEQYPGRLIMLCDGARILARSESAGAAIATGERDLGCTGAVACGVSTRRSRLLADLPENML